MTPAASKIDVATLSPVQRWKTALQALAKIMVNPDDTEAVLVFSTYANAGTMYDRLDNFHGDPDGARIYREQRAIDASTDLEALEALPDGTLGRAYVQFLRSHGFTPDIFSGPVDDVSDPKVAYVIQRMRQTHDLWHVVTGHETNPAGEVALQAFTFGQVRAPSTLIISAMGTLRGLRETPTLAKDVILAFRAGRAAHPFVTFPWEDHWATPLEEVRAMLGVTPVAAAA